MQETMIWNALSAISSLMGVVLTAILTFIIIRQTNNLNKKQLSLQKRQIRIDTFNYKRDIFLSVIKILEFTKTYSRSVSTKNVKPKKVSNIFDIFELTAKNLFDNHDVVVNSLSEAEYILPKEISSIIIIIGDKFSLICSYFEMYKQHERFNLAEDVLATEKDEIFDNIKLACETINSHASILHMFMIKELDISDLDR